MLQSLANGVVYGGLFALLGVAFSVVYSTTGVFFVALGAIYTLAPYFVMWAIEHGVPFVAAAPLSVAACALLGLLSEFLVHWPFEMRRAPHEVHLIASLGVFLLVAQSCAVIWGPDAQLLFPGIDSVHELLSIRVTGGQVWGLVTATMALAFFFAWLRGSGTGLELRAMACNHRLLAVLGRDVRRLRLLVFSISGGLAGVAAIAAARDLPFDPNVGMRAVLIGLAATIIGGRSSLAGAALAGLLLGLLRTQVVWQTSARWEDAATFVIVALCLFGFPRGLGGLTQRNLRVEEGM